MKYFNIEIDQEVYQYLLGMIRDFNDTPNLILRRELLGNRVQEHESQSSLYQMPKFPDGTPIALQHILEMIFLVKKRGMSRVDATKSVSKRHQVTRETVLDKYGRQLNKSTSEIDWLLQDENLNKFKTIIIKKFYNHRNLVETFFNDEFDDKIINSKDHNISTLSNASSNEKYIPLEILARRGNDLSKSKPLSILINNEEFKVTSWTNFDEVVIRWFIKEGTLTHSRLPIRITKEKYFLNSRPAHQYDSLDGKWNKINEGIYFDSKYNAANHIRNVLILIEQLSAEEPCEIKLALK